MQDKILSKLIREAKRTALAEFLGCSAQIILSPHHENIFEVWEQEYLVLTEQEADDAIAKQIAEDELWLFYPEWIMKHTLLRDGMQFEDSEHKAILQAFTAIQERMMEMSHPMLKGLIEATCGMPSFVAEAIAHNGRGHFLAPYDRDEKRQGDFYIYRMN